LEDYRARNPDSTGAGFHRKTDHRNQQLRSGGRGGAKLAMARTHQCLANRSGQIVYKLRTPESHFDFAGCTLTSTSSLASPEKASVAGKTAAQNVRNAS